MPEQGEVLTQDVTAEVFKYTPENWEEIRDDVEHLARYARSERLFSTDNIAEWLKGEFELEDPDLIRILLKKGGRVIGFSLASRSWSYSDEQKKFVPSNSTAEINTTVISKDYQGKGLIGTVMEKMEEELRTRGFTEMKRFSRSTKGYADAIKRHYRDRVTRVSTVLSLIHI